MHYAVDVVWRWLAIMEHRTGEALTACWRWINILAYRIGEALNSWLGHRIEVAITALILVVASFIFARKIANDVSLAYKNLSGAKLKHVDDAKKRTARLARLRGHRLRFMGYGLLVMSFFALFAFVIPSSILAAGIYFYDWFFPNAAALTQQAGCDLWSAAHPNSQTLLYFVLSQFLMGFGHTLELYIPQSHSLASAGALNPASGAVGLVLTGYRYFVAGFTGVFLNYIRKIISIFWLISPEEARLASMR